MIEDLKELLDTMQVASADLQNLLSPERAHTWGEGDSKKDHKRIKYSIFAIASIHLSVEQYYYSKVDGFRNSDKAKVILDKWKKSPEVLTVKSLRNRIQHKPMMDGTLNVNWIAAEDNTKGTFKLNYRIDESEIVSGTKDFSIPNKEIVQNFLLKIKNNENFIIDVLSTYLGTTTILLNDLTDIYKIEFADEFVQRQSVLDELNAIEAWLDGKGLIRVNF